MFTDREEFILELIEKYGREGLKRPDIQRLYMRRFGHLKVPLRSITSALGSIKTKRKGKENLMPSAKSLSFSLRKYIQNQMENGRGQFAEARNVETFEENGLSDLSDNSGGVVVEFPYSTFQIAIDRQD